MPQTTYPKNITRSQFQSDFRRDLIECLTGRNAGANLYYSLDKKSSNSNNNKGDIVLYVPKMVVNKNKENPVIEFLDDIVTGDLNNWNKNVLKKELKPPKIQNGFFNYYTITCEFNTPTTREPYIIVTAKAKELWFIKFNPANNTISLKVRCRPKGDTAVKQFKAKDFLYGCQTVRTITYEQFSKKEKEGNSYVFNDAMALKRAVENSLSKNTKFDALERQAMKAFLDSLDGSLSKANVEQKTKTNNGFSCGFPELKNIVSLMAAFSEIVVPYLFLSHKIPSVVGVNDYSGGVTSVAFPDFDVEKIDFVVFYKSSYDTNKINRMNFSMKYGTGHEVSVGDLIKTDGIDLESLKTSKTNSNIKFLSELRGFFDLYKGKRFSDIGVSDIFCIKKSGCFDSIQGKVNSKSEDVYLELFKNYKKYNDKIDDYRVYLNTNQKETFKKLEALKENLIKTANKMGVSYDLAYFEQFYPFSLSRLVALMIAKATADDKVKNALKALILEGGYHQIRIDNTKARKGILSFNIIPIFGTNNAKIEINFKVSSGWKDFKLKSGSHFVGYTLK